MTLSSAVFASDNYIVRNIAVDIEGESATQAREKALNTARRNGFNVMVNRVTNGANTPDADDRTIASMVNNFEINREKLSKNRYLASVNVTFNERAVQAYLGRNTTVAINDDVSLSPTLNVNRLAKTYQTHQMHVGLNGIRQWIRIQTMLNAHPTIASVSIESLRSNMAVINVTYNGSIELMAQDISARGFQILQNNIAGQSPYILTVSGI
jgi:hypothetical protein